MLLPTTHFSALLLLLLSFVCLGSWANTFKLTGSRWRFELFYFDFAIGAVVLAIVAAYTLGSFGELAFSDRMLVAGRTAQAWVLLAGVIFNFGNMLLLAAISLLGMSLAFPSAIGIALVIWCCFRIRPANAPLLSIAIVLMILAVVLDAFSCRKAVATPNKIAHRDHNGYKRSRRSTKGIITAILGGVALGLFYPVAANGMDPDYGVGPYAGVLLLCIGIFLSTILLGPYFMKIAIEGASLTFNNYLRGGAQKHLLGFAGGLICMTGILAAALVDAASSSTSLSKAAVFIVPLASVLLAMAWGIMRWKELKPFSGNPKFLLAGAALSFACGLVAMGFALAR